MNKKILFFIKKCNNYIDSKEYIKANYLIFFLFNYIKKIGKIEYYESASTLKNKLYEKILYDNLSNEDIIKYNNILFELRKNLINKNYKAALNDCSIGIYLTDAPIFKYYMGKIYYILENYEESKIYFNQYNKTLLQIKNK